jgi:hypothetical protein
VLDHMQCHVIGWRSGPKATTPTCLGLLVCFFTVFYYFLIMFIFRYFNDLYNEHQALTESYDGYLDATSTTTTWVLQRPRTQYQAGLWYEHDKLLTTNIRCHHISTTVLRPPQRVDEYTCKQVTTRAQVHFSPLSFTLYIY